MSLTAPSAFWDVTGDNLPDLNPTAVYIGGVSGVHRGAQLYFQNDEVTPLVLPYDVLLTASAGGVIIGTYFAAAGTLLSNAASWSGALAADLAGNYSGAATHTVDADFSKLTFAVLQGWTYSSARTIQVKIQAIKGGETSQNSGNFLSMGIQASVGGLAFPTDMDVKNYGSNGVLVHVGQYGLEATANQGVMDIQTATGNQSKNRIITDAGVSIGGTLARYFVDTASPTGFSVVWVQNLTVAPARLNLYRSTITAFDSDGFPIYGLAQNINGPGVAASQALPWSGVCINEAIFSGGMPLVLISKGTFQHRNSIMSNTGTAANPDYNTTPLDLNVIDASLVGLALCRADSVGKLYTPRPGLGGLFGQFSRLTYTGANDNAAALVTAINWSFERLGFAAALSPAANGDGLTFQGDTYGVAIDEDNTVNSEPTVYVTDATNHVLWKVTRNGLSLGTAADWDWLIVVGQTGVAGNADGIGILATLNNPRGIDYEDGFLYISCRGAHTARKVNVSTLDTTNFFGVNGVGAQVAQFNF